jgi:hypothetical protein
MVKGQELLLKTKSTPQPCPEVDPDPGSGERAGARHFTFKFMQSRSISMMFSKLPNLMVNFKDIFQIPKSHGQFQRYFANKTPQVSPLDLGLDGGNPHEC